jgi:N-acetylmuramoyl-L-alanine amidase
MPISFRVAFTSACALLLAAAAQVPVPALADTPAAAVRQELGMSAFTDGVIGSHDDDVMIPEVPSKPEPTSLRELVSSIAALPAADLSDDARCLAIAVYHESKGEPVEGQLAVAQVILNRVESGHFASSICGVVRQPGQFSFVYRTPGTSAQWRTAQAVAIVAITENWHEVAPNSTYFHAKRVAPGWTSVKRVSAIGNHIFYARR